MIRSRPYSRLAAAARTSVLLLPLVTGPLVAQEAVEPGSPEVAAADSAARLWLGLIDDGKWDDAWVSGANSLQVAASPQKLKSAIGGGRSGLDSLAARTLVGYRTITNPPNASPGDYVILQYRLQGTPSWSAVETVIPRREDGTWRVTAYTIKRDR
ncbi:MAG: DUF4019 domain-containing protein [Gemmatimonadales bacterium]